MLVADGIRFGLHSRPGRLLLSNQILEGVPPLATQRIDHVEAQAKAVEGPDRRWSNDIVIVASGFLRWAPDLPAGLTLRPVAWRVWLDHATVSQQGATREGSARFHPAQGHS